MAGQNAIQRIEREIVDEAQMGPVALTLADILQPNVNLAEMLTDEELAKIGQHVLRDVEIDKASRADWLKRYQRWLDIAMQVRGPKNFPWPDASNVKWPLLTVASIQFQARAYPAIVEGSNLVKGRVLGPDPDGEKRARADRIGQHMTWQLLYKMLGWEEETDRLLLIVPITGCEFRKSYHDSIAGSNVSERVSAEDFIINYWAKSLDSAPRYTHVLHYYPHEVQEKVAAGLWLSVPVEPQSEDAHDEDALTDFYEQHRNIDLDGDGYPEPYVVTTTLEGKVARIAPCFGPDEVTVATGVGVMKLAEAAKSNAEPLHVVRIERRGYFTKYGLIPAPDGSFYDIGFGSLLEDLTASIDTTVNQMLDAGALQNAGGGFLGTGINLRGGNLTRRLGEWKRVDIAQGTLRDNIFHLEHPGPSAVLFSLLGMLIEAAKEITAVQDVMVGEGKSNQPATTTLALIEQGHKVMTAIFKRIHRAFGQELRILRRLNRDYLDEEEYFQLNDADEPGQITRQDYADADLDVVPVSDPNTVSDMQKIARAQALLGFVNDPLVNQTAIREIAIEAMGLGAEKKRLLTVPQPAPDPKILIEGMKEARAKLLDAAKVRASDAAAALKLVEAAERALMLGQVDDATAFMTAAQELGGDLDDDADPSFGPGDLPGMEGQPPDPGISPIPEGPPGGPAGGMGPGPDILPGTPGGSSPLGPAGGDQLA